MKKKENGITLIALVITVVLLIILAAITLNLTMGQNGIITRALQAKNETESAKIKEEQALNELYEQLIKETGLSNDTSEVVAKLAEFKKAISDYIGQAGGIKPEYTADTATFGESIKGIVKEVTKNATANADNITKDKTAWINGESITGTGADNDSHYNSGKQDSVQTVVVSLYKNPAKKYSIAGKSIGVESDHNHSWDEKSDSFSYNSGHINIYKNPDNQTAALSNISFSVSSSAYVNTNGWGDMANAGIEYSVYLEDGTLIKSGNSSASVNISLFDYDIGNNTYLYIIANGSCYARSGTGADSFGRASSQISTIGMSYIPINL